jgi:hypothetical protein
MKDEGRAECVKRQNVKTGEARTGAGGTLLARFTGCYSLFSLYGYNTFTFFWGFTQLNSRKTLCEAIVWS